MNIMVQRTWKRLAILIVELHFFKNHTNPRNSLTLDEEEKEKHMCKELKILIILSKHKQMFFFLKYKLGIIFYFATSSTT